MASQAEVDLVISTADTLPELERDLSRIIRTAENGAPELDVEATLAVGASLANLAEELDQVVQAAEAGAENVELEAALDAQRSLSYIQGQIESIVQRVEQGEEIELQAELDRVGSLSQVGNQIRSLVRQVEEAAPEIEIEADVDRGGRTTASLGRLTSGLTAVIGPLGRVTAGVGALGAAAGTAGPLIAGVVASIEAIAPAAAVGVSALLALQLATATVKIGMIGVKEAISTAFDPEAKPEELAKALARLAPEARDFVTQLRSMRGRFDELRLDVQNNLFKGLDEVLAGLSTDVVPQFSTALRSTSVTLNQMVQGVGAAAIELGRNGTLQTALLGATNGLANLRAVPGQVTTALGQLAAASAPAFERITQAAANASTRIADRLGKAFESGALENAINRAVDLLAEFGAGVGNIFEGLGNITDALAADGQGLFDVFGQITQAFADVTATEGFQDALRALSTTMGVVAETVLPLISQALQTLGPIFERLAPPVQTIVRILGDNLGKVLTVLEPVLVTVADAFGKLLVALTPLIPLAGDLLVAILPGLVPLFEGLGQTFVAMTPFITELAGTLGSALLPVFTNLATTVLPQLVPLLVDLSTMIFPLLADILVQLAPTLAELGVKFAEVAIAATPLIAKILELAIKFGEDLAPVLGPLLELIIDLVEGGLKFLLYQLETFVIPAIEILVNLLNGDFSAAWDKAEEVITKFGNDVRNKIREMAQAVEDKLRELANAAINKGRELVDGFSREFNRIVGRARDIAGQIDDAVLAGLGHLGNLLYSAGADIIQGLINGISGKLARLREIASEVASVVSGTVKNALGISSPSKVMREQGRDTMDGFLLGLNDRLPDLSTQLQGIAATVPSFALPNGSTLALPQFGQQGAPRIQVFIGNEQLTGRIDYQIMENNRMRDRVAAQGVRR